MATHDVRLRALERRSVNSKSPSRVWYWKEGFAGKHRRTIISLTRCHWLGIPPGKSVFLYNPQTEIIEVVAIPSSCRLVYRIKGSRVMQSQIRNWLLYPDINLYLWPALVLCISSDRYTLRGIVKVVVEGKKSSSYLMLQDSMRHIGELQKISIRIAQEIRIDSCYTSHHAAKKTSLFPCKLS